MNRVSSWIQNILLRQVITVFLVVFTFFGIQAFGFNQLQALADDTVKSPYGIYYKGTPDESVVNQGNNATVEGSKNKLKETADNVKEGAKDFLNSTKKGLEKDDTVDNAKNKLKETADNVKEGAKDFANSTKKGVQEAAQSTGETVKSPYGIYYKGTPDETKVGNQANNINNNVDSKNPLQSIVDNVREKLNLDEPLPESTKEFLDSTEKRVEKAVEPITGTKEGYHQIK